MNLLLVDSSVSQEEQSTFSLPSGALLLLSDCMQALPALVVLDICKYECSLLPVLLPHW